MGRRELPHPEGQEKNAADEMTSEQARYNWECNLLNSVPYSIHTAFFLTVTIREVKTTIDI
jgi:hypothetical protein